MRDEVGGAVVAVASGLASDALRHLDDHPVQRETVASPLNAIPSLTAASCVVIAWIVAAAAAAAAGDFEYRTCRRSYHVLNIDSKE